MSLGPVLLGTEQLGNRRRLFSLLDRIRCDEIEYQANRTRILRVYLINQSCPYNTMLCEKLKLCLVAVNTRNGTFSPKKTLWDECVCLALKKHLFWRTKPHEIFLKQAPLTESFSNLICSLVCHWTACMTMASHLLSRFTIISCMDWWSAFRLQVSWSSRRCWHSRSTEATPRRLCLISQHRDCRTDKQQMSAWNTAN